MRFCVWCSAAVLLTACGAGHGAADPFAYDASVPLAVHNAGLYASSPRADIHAVTFRGIGTTRVGAYLVVPRSAGRHPAVLFLHGSGGNRKDLIVAAAKLALRGAVTMTISEPNDARTYRPLVVDARRALDLLTSRLDVDPSRLGVVGFSLGAQTAAILAGDDPRPKAVGVIAGRGTDVARYWIRRTRAHLFFQAGTEDAVVPHPQLLALMRAAPDDPRIAWYGLGHDLGTRLLADQLNWQASELSLG
jgi:dienelactone hydrolase